MFVAVETFKRTAHKKQKNVRIQPRTFVREQLLAVEISRCCKHFVRELILASALLPIAFVCSHQNVREQMFATLCCFMLFANSFLLLLRDRKHLSVHEHFYFVVLNVV